jgi:uncharacterized protein (TIGR00375 family)
MPETRFVADLHLHSRYARATSRELNPGNLHRWAALKGITVVGTGDLTHPAWLSELREQLEPAEEGLYRLHREWLEPAEHDLPPSCTAEVRFLLSGEISTIYKRAGRTRKVHSVVLLPTMESAEALNARLAAIGNLHADGRPILGLDCRDLLAICLEVCPEVLLIPAHIWTPHFSVLGASSGFDSLEECFGELLPHVHAVETGLSSDPPMNWRLSALDRFAIVSNSDAHSPRKLGREATCFATELSYPGIHAALSQPASGRLAGTLEFYPEEGKYHYDGHRKCGICWRPPQTLAAEGRCSVCGRPVTVGVLHRVELLADRPEAPISSSRPPFEYLIPLEEVIGSCLGMGPGSQRVQAIYDRLLALLGPELQILRTVDPEEVARHGEPLIAEGVRRMRRGEINIAPGYDGEFGRIEVFTEEERGRLLGQTALLAGTATPRRGRPRRTPEPSARHAPRRETVARHEPDDLDEDQRRIVEAEGGPLLVSAGPGSGKTRVLVWRVAHLVRDRGVAPAAVTAVTFTHRAAGEMRSRLERLLGVVPGIADLRVGTFHALALELFDRADLPRRELLDEIEARQVLAEALGDKVSASRRTRLAEAISLAKAAGLRPGEVTDPEEADVYAAYRDRLAAYRARDYDDLLLDWVALLENDPVVLAEARQQAAFLLVDEFQDLNPVQYRLVRLLAGDGHGLLAIGDPDQAIYGFRGASPRFFAALSHDFPATRLFRLAANYRSQAAIVATASSVIASDGDRPGGWCRAVLPAGPRVRLLEVPSETSEGIAVVREIGRMIGGADMNQADGSGAARSFGDFAVLFRTGAQAAALEACFLHEGLPFRSVGSRALLEADSVRQALAWARYVLQPDSVLRLLGVLSEGPFQADAAALAQVRERLATGNPAPPMLVEIAGRYRGLAPADFFARWQREYGRVEDEDLGLLCQMARGAASLEEFLRRVLLGRGTDHERRGGPGGPASEAVGLLTLHAAKGLEYPVVFICGVEDGLVPHGEDKVDLDEERRLLYVGMTRAREELVLLRARTRTRYGERVQTRLSPFVSEMAGELLVREEVNPPPSRRGDGQLSLF